MKPLQIGMPGYRLNEYKIILSPHADLEEKIKKVRVSFSEEFKTTNAIYGRPHLTLAHFFQYEMKEERITNKLKQIAMAYRPFKAELKDFGSYPAHSIFINMTSKLSVQALVKEIRTEAQKLMKVDEEHKPHFILEPNFIIGRKLLPWQYEQGWHLYSHKHFTARFIADGFLLLKREVGGKNYEIVQRYHFENMLMGVTQGQLF